MGEVSTKAELHASDLEALPQEKGVELINGEFVERPMGFLSSLVGGKLYRLLGNAVEPLGLGWTAPADAGYQCFPDAPNDVRKPDVSFIRRGRLPNGPPSRGYVTVAPDLVAEVISPNDLAYEVDAKVDAYLAAGVLLVWVVNPQTRSVRVHRQDGSVSLLREGDELSGEEIVPGFRVPVDSLFAL